MDQFHLRDGELYDEDVPLARIAEEVGTPVYVYSRATLERPEALLSLSAEARCTLTEARLESPLFTDHDHHEHGSAAHNDIQAHYRYDCTAPDALRALDLRQLFEAFPGTERVEAQIIGPNGQQGGQVRAQQTRITF